MRLVRLYTGVIQCILCMLSVTSQTELRTLRVADLREDECFVRYYRGQCSSGLMGLHSRSTCCCSIGAAWSAACEPCPARDSTEYIDLCQGTRCDVALRYDSLLPENMSVVC